MRSAFVARRAVVLPALAGLVFVGAWQAAALAGMLNPHFFSSPADVVSTGWSDIRTGTFWSNAFVTARELALGYALAVAVGVPFGVVAGSARPLRHLFAPWLNALNATPRISLLPLVILWFGLGYASKVALVFLGVSITVTVNTFYGAQALDRRFLDVAQVFGASRPRRIWTVVVPSTVPFILVGMRVGIGLGVAAVMLGEFVTSEEGIGNYIFRAGHSLQADRVLFGAAFVTVFALFAFLGIGRLERRFSRWRPRVGSA